MLWHIPPGPGQAVASIVQALLSLQSAATLQLRAHTLLTQ